MHVVTLAWMYVAVMMAVAEATSTQGTILGAVITFVLYGLLPLGLVLYVMGTPARKRARAAQEAREAEEAQMAQQAPETHPDDVPPGAKAASTGDVLPEPDAGDHAPTDPSAKPV